MANFVTKKDGSKEPFDQEKIVRGVSMAGAQAGLSEQECEELAAKAVNAVQESIADLEEVPGVEIREKILAFLDKESPKTAEAWRNYEANKTE